MKHLGLLLVCLVLQFAVPAHAKQGEVALSVPQGFSTLGTDRDPVSGLPMMIRHDLTGYELLYVPAGAVPLGSPESDPDANPTEMPVARTFVPGYWIGRCEVTNAQFRLFRPAHRSGNINGHTLDGDSQPVVMVTWQDATAFCTWSGMRLPSEAEWEKAARGSDQRRYAWGNEMPPRRPLGNLADSTAFRFFTYLPAVPGYDDRYAVSAPVGSFPQGASPCGALDMTGNAAEWCRDGWDARMREFVAQFMDIDDEAAQSHRIYRGGSFFGGPKALRAAARSSYPLDSEEDDIGFRAALSPGQ